MIRCAKCSRAIASGWSVTVDGREFHRACAPKKEPKQRGPFSSIVETETGEVDVSKIASYERLDGVPERFEFQLDAGGTFVLLGSYGERVVSAWREWVFLIEAKRQLVHEVVDRDVPARSEIAALLRDALVHLPLAGGGNWHGKDAWWNKAAEMADRLDGMATVGPSAPYGYCPRCGARGRSRERRPGGNDRCEAGHVYPSRDAVREGTELAGESPASQGDDDSPQPERGES